MAFEVTTYNVGQGLFNLVREKDANGNCYCAIFDCGTIAMSQSKTKDAILKDAINKIGEYGQLNAIFISHQDVDHWSWVLELLKKLYGKSIDGNTFYRYMVDNMDVASCFHKDHTITVSKEGNRYCYYYKDKDIIENITFWITEECVKIYERISIDFYVNELHILIKLENDQIRIKIEEVICGYIFDWKCFRLMQFSEYDVNQAIHEYLSSYLSCYMEYLGRIKNAVKKILDKLCMIDYNDINSIINLAKADRAQHQNITFYMGGLAKGWSYENLILQLKLFGTVIKTENALLKIDMFNVCHKGMLGFKGYNFGELPSNIQKNASSMICLYVARNGARFLFPGDATFHTFLNLEKKITILQEIPISLMIAPHHGSFDTNIMVNENNEILEKQRLSELCEKLQLETMYISAYHTKFGHPDVCFIENVIQYFENMGMKSTDMHNIVYSDKDKSYYCVEINTPIYTTEIGDDIIYYEEDQFVNKEKRFYSERKERVILPTEDMFL